MSRLEALRGEHRGQYGHTGDLLRPQPTSSANGVSTITSSSQTRCGQAVQGLRSLDAHPRRGLSACTPRSRGYWQPHQRRPLMRPQRPCLSLRAVRTRTGAPSDWRQRRGSASGGGDSSATSGADIGAAGPGEGCFGPPPFVATPSIDAPGVRGDSALAAIIGRRSIRVGASSISSTSGAQLRRR